MAESNIEIVFDGWLDARRRGDLEAMAARLAPDVVHQGIRPELICRNRDEVLALVRGGRGQLPVPEAIELVAEGSQEPRGEATVVFTLERGKIVRMQDYLHRSDALQAVGAATPWS
jgi:SnoaL-like domain